MTTAAPTSRLFDIEYWGVKHQQRTDTKIVAQSGSGEILRIDPKIVAQSGDGSI